MSNDNGSKEGKHSAKQTSRLGDSPSPAEAASALRSDVSPEKEDAARTAGRGFLMITGAKVWFMVMGALVSIGLPMVMSPEEFGIYSIIINAVSLVNMVIVTATVQAVAKLISERPERATRTLAQAGVLQCFVGLPLGVAYVLGGGVIAGWFNDPSLTPLLRLSGGILLSYAFYSIFVGYFNGLKAFGRQAILDVTFATLKSVLILGAVALGLGVTGAVGGFVATAVIVAVGAGIYVVVHARRNPSPSDDDANADVRKQLAVYLFLVMLYTFGVNVVLRADLFLLKSLLAAQPEGFHLDSNAVAGVYAAMLNLARLPYQAVIAVTFVVFPMISKATFESDHDATQSYIRQTLRYSFILLALLGVLVSGNAREIVLTLYGDTYSGGIAPLMLLSLATVGFALFFIATTMITGAGRPAVSVGLATLMMIATAGLNVLLIEGALALEEVTAVGLMNAAATATASAMVGGCAAAVGYLLWRYDAGLPWLTLFRGAFGATLVFVLSLIVPTPEGLGRPVLLALVVGKGAVGALIFLAWLWLSREFGQEDRDRLKRVFRRRSPKT